jgi:hypothetical protein
VGSTIKKWRFTVDESSMKELLKYVKALVALQVQALSKAEDQVKPELLLARAGLPAREIGGLLGKSPAAVAKTIQRAGKDEV